MKIFIRFLLGIFGAIALLNISTLNVFAQSVDDFTVKLFEIEAGPAYLPTESAPDLGSSARPMGDIYAGTLNVSGLSLSGNFDLTANDLLHVDSIFGSTAILPVRIGDAATTSHSLASEDDLLVTGRLEVDGRSDFDGNTWFNAGGVNLSTNMDVSNDVAIKNVSNQGGIYPIRTAQTPDASELVTGSLSNAWHLMEYADGTFDFAFPIQTNPTFVYHSANQSTTEWGSLAHDQTNFVINTGAGGVSIPVRFLQTQGPDIPSASTLSVDGSGNLFQNIFELTGTTAVNLIDSTGLTEGSKITLICNESVTINHGTATSSANITILLAGSANFSCTANDTLTLMLSSTTAGGQAWREIARTAI